MARYPIKMLKDENGTPFVPLVAPEAVKDNQGTDWQTLLNSKLEKTNIIAGDNITLSVSGNNITINSQAGGATTNVIDNLNQQTAGVGVLDAHQGYVLKGMIPGVQNSLTSTSTTTPLSAAQGKTLNDILSNIGSFVSSGAEITATASQGQSNNICSLSLPAGTWLVIGHWRYEGNEVSSYTAIENISLSLPDSVFDDNGWVNKTVIGIQQSGTATTPYLNLWPRNKTISVKCAMYAIRIK